MFEIAFLIYLKDLMKLLTIWNEEMRRFAVGEFKAYIFYTIFHFLGLSQCFSVN